MLHPHTELRFVSQEIGYGVFATQFIPMGTMMWVRDELDRIIPQKELKKFSNSNLENLLKYTYRNSQGDYVFCWDLTRYINHSYKPNSMLTALGFEIAIRDIQIGEEITNDYGTLNIIEAFRCASGPHESREFVKPDDLVRFHALWDKHIVQAFGQFSSVDQPLYRFLTCKQTDQLKSILAGEIKMPSVLENLFKQ